ncbi:MAG: DUF3800 domain-containing protein [Betaproteobacteria bacterium]|nr:MAG: DUF3800 domain-containing protein [Betaproteobacteria bacterium]
MALQAFIDESYDRNGIFVLAGCISYSESWDAFTKEWSELLQYGTLNKHGRYHFKMSQMAINEERMSRVPAFVKIIEKHVLAFVSVKIDESELRRALSRIWVPNVAIDWAMLVNSYYATFRCLLDMFHLNRSEMTQVFSANERIDFIFDSQVEEKAILSSWDEYIKEQPVEVKQYYGEIPRFEDDEEFLPLQAADFWAWWVRKWYVDRTPEKILASDFCIFELQDLRKYLRFEISFNEEQLVTVMKRILRTQIGK